MGRLNIRSGVKKIRGKDVFLVLFAVLLGVAAVLFIRTTPDGLGLVSDSVNYLNGAANIASGNGYARLSGDQTLKPITNFPPFYSILLAVPILFGAAPVSAAWGLALMFYLLNLALIGWLVYRVASSPSLGFAASTLFLVSRPFLYFQSFAMSESIFFFLTVACFVLTVEALRSDRNLFWFGAGICAGLAFITRYIGAASLGMALVAIWAISNRENGFRKRLIATGVTLLGAVPIMASWLIRNQLVTGNSMNRAAGVHLLGLDDFRTGVLIFWKWFAPVRYARLESPVSWMGTLVILLGVGMILFCVGVWVRYLRGWEAPLTLRFVWAAFVYIFGYFAMVYLTISFLDASVNIEERILYPMWMVLLLAAAAVISALITWISPRWKRWAVAVFAVGYAFLWIAFAAETRAFVPKFAANQYGWAWSGWADSPAMNLIAELPESMTIYSNQQEAVSFWTGRGAYALLDPIDPSNDLPRSGYDDVQKEIRRQVESGDAVLVFFQIGSWLDGENWVTRLTDGLPVIYADESEWVLGVVPE